MLGLRAVDGLRAAIGFIILLIILPDKNETPTLGYLGQRTRAYTSQEEPLTPLPLQSLGSDVPCKLSEETFADVQPWDFLRPPTNSFFTYEADEPTAADSLNPLDKREYDVTVMTANALLTREGFNGEEIPAYGYRRIVRGVGSEYRFVYIGQEAALSAQYTVTLVLPFDGHAQAGIKQASGLGLRRINVVVPVRGRWPTMVQFLAQYLTVDPVASNLRLVLVCFGDSHECGSLREYVSEQVGKLAARSGKELFIVVQATGPFSRAQGLALGAAAVQDDEVLFFCDVDMIVDAAFYNRCRGNVDQGKQVFFPIVYSLYRNGKEVRRNEGFFRRLGYGMGCMYRSDFDRVGAYQNAPKFRDWGKEDVDLFARFLDSELAVLRAMEPGLRHQWHEKSCKSTSPRDACFNSMLSALGSQESLARALWRSGIAIGDLDVGASKLVAAAGNDPAAGEREYIAEWERKLREKQRKKRRKKPPLENIYLEPRVNT